jgi:hypothetical protein
VRGWGSAHALVDRHFAGHGDGDADGRLFRHLRRCADCRGRYRSLSLLEALEPTSGQDARARLGRGIFPAVPTRSAGRRPVVWLSALAAVGLGGLLLVRLPRHEGSSFAPRGPADAVTARAALTLYRVPERGAPERTGAVLRAGDALAFSYANPSAHGYLMVFAYDGAGHVFWFWPAWSEAATDPQAVPIRAGGGPVELVEAVRHPLRPGALTLVGLFLDRPISVHQVEGALADPQGLSTLGGETWQERLEVLP